MKAKNQVLSVVLETPKPKVFPQILLSIGLFLVATALIAWYLLINSFFPFAKEGSSKVMGAKTVNSAKIFDRPLIHTASAAAEIKENQATPAATFVPANNGPTVRVPILIYHYVGNNPNPQDKLRDALSVTPDVFEAQMSYLASNGYNTISLDTLYAALKGGELPSKPIILTFDDGYIDFYVNAFPILRKYNLQATSFIPTDLVGTAYYLHWDQIREMDQTGLVSFQAHSLNHVNLASLSQGEVWGQVTESKKRLEKELGKPVNFMAYPYGGASPMVLGEVKKAGYMGALGTWLGYEQSLGTQFDWPRVRVGNVDMEIFISRL